MVTRFFFFTIVIITMSVPKKLVINALLIIVLINIVLSTSFSLIYEDNLRLSFLKIRKVTADRRACRLLRQQKLRVRTRRKW